jgi:hypothetical protein
MRTKFLWMGMGIAVAGGIGAVWHESAQAAEAERARERTEHRIAQLRGERQSLEDRLAQLARTLAATGAELATLELDKGKGEKKAGVKPTDAGSAAASGTLAPKRADVWERSIRSEPELQALRLVADRARRATDFEAFFRKCGLGPEQIARFQAIATAHDEATADIDAAVQSQGLTEDDASVEQLRQTANAENEARLRALLGVDGLQQFREFEATLSLRSAVRGFAAVALDAGVPLSAPQAEQLAAALVESRKATGERKVPNWSAVDERARWFLGAEQLALLQRVEPNTHGAGGRHWLVLQEAVREARGGKTVGDHKP